MVGFCISTEEIVSESTSRERKMSEAEDVFKKDLNNNNKNKNTQNHDKFRFLNYFYDPMFVLVVLIYGLTRIIEWIYGSEGFWQNTWIRFVEYVDVDEHDFTIWVTSTAVFIFYWIFSICFLCLDFTGSLKKYKIQPGKNDPLDKQKLIGSLFTVMFNQIIISTTFTSGTYWLSQMRLGPRDMREVDSFFIIIRNLMISHIYFDVGFYILHRLLHTKYLYKRIHKIHHEWKSPIAVISIYSHPTEHLITNLIPALVGPVLMHARLSTIWIWLISVALNTVSDHSGYHMPFLKSPEFHDYHHVAFSECFGTSGLMDYLLQTDLKFRRSINFKRHRILLSLKASMRELYPKNDNVKCK